MNAREVLGSPLPRCAYHGVLAGLMLMASVLAGCAAPPGAATAAGSGEIVTASDETEGQRRARIRLELAAGYFEAGKTTVALDEVKQALIADPNSADAYNLRGLIYLRLSDYGIAEDSFRRALALRPGDPDLRHNYGWLLCQQRRFVEAEQNFAAALASPVYQAKDKTLMARGLCQSAAQQYAEAEQSFFKSYELNPGNPVVGYNLASLLLRRHDAERARFYIRRVNNSEFANAESLWLGIKIERTLGNTVAMGQLADQLHKRFPDSREWAAYERGAFND